MVATLKINKKLIQKIKGKYINTNSCAPLVLRRFAESHELIMNSMRSNYMVNYMVITC